MPREGCWIGQTDWGYNFDRGRHLSYQRGKVGDMNYTILLCKTVLTTPSEIQIRGLGGH